MRSKKLIAVTALVGLALASLRCSDGDPPHTGPIVQRVSDTAAHVILHRAQPSSASLRWRAEAEGGSAGGDAAWSVAETPAPSKMPRFVLSELRPATRYAYSLVVRVAEPGASVEAREEERFAGSFTTASKAGTGRVRFAALGDSGKIPWWTKNEGRLGVTIAEWLQGIVPGRGHQWIVARRVLERDPALVLHLGDIVYPDGAREHYNEGYFEPFAELLARVPVWPTIGNHDAHTENAQPVLDLFDLPGAKRYYDFVHGPVHFVCIDTFTTSLDKGTAQRAWLETTLRGPKLAPWRVVFTHRPFLTVSRSAPDPQNKATFDALHPLFREHGVRLVLSGHDHNYQRFRPRGGVHYVVAGGGGKSLYDHGTSDDLVSVLRDYSFALIDADAESMKLQGIDQAGQAFDSVEIKRD